MSGIFSFRIYESNGEVGEGETEQGKMLKSHIPSSSSFFFGSDFSFSDLYIHFIIYADTIKFWEYSIRFFEKGAGRQQKKNLECSRMEIPWIFVYFSYHFFFLCHGLNLVLGSCKTGAGNELQCIFNA